MLNPQYVDDTKNGIVTLSKYFDYKLRAESWYTIAILSNGLYQAYENDATGYGFTFEFTNADGEFYNYEAERDGVLNDIANAIFVIMFYIVVKVVLIIILLLVLFLLEKRLELALLRNGGRYWICGRRWNIGSVKSHK